MVNSTNFELSDSISPNHAMSHFLLGSKGIEGNQSLTVSVVVSEEEAGQYILIIWFDN